MLRFWLFLALGAIALPLQAEVLIPASSTWKYFKGRSEASSPDVAGWRATTFNDATWLSGPAPFHYGEGLAGGTLLSDMQGNYSTLFVRKNFSITNLSQITAADLDVRADDGFVAWLNGQQVASKAPPAVITFNALASANAPEPVQFETFSVPVSALRSGDNVLAIQLFNISLAGSSDAQLDAQLITRERETISPIIVRVVPAIGAVTNLTQLSVTFSEPVVGVNASDLRINDVSATSVVGSGTNYTFTFPQPPFGDVQVSWSIDANITDTAVPPNPFNRSAPSANFFYDLVDPTVPLIAFTYPPQGITVNQLSQLEILFNKTVTGIDLSDLLINGQAATNMVGIGPGPYRFEFRALPNGPVSITWAANHGIKDTTDRANPFNASGWSYTVNSTQPLPRIRINEVMAANVNGLLDQEGAVEDWIELYNEGDVAVNLEGWSLSDDPTKPGQWVFPRITIGPRQFLIVFASGKDIRDVNAPRLHTNFKLNLLGEYLGLFNADAPRRTVAEFAPEYPEQRNDYSYGLNSAGEWRYFRTPTPGAQNGASTIADVVEPVYFSVERGFFSAAFHLSLHTPTPGAIVRYTLDGSEPTELIGTNFTSPLLIDRTRTVRAAAFKSNSLPSVSRTHSYLFNIPVNRSRLPGMSLVTGTNHLYGTTGIMEVSPRNTTKHGIAWERPISVELINPEDNEGFQIMSGIRIQGGGYIRERYNYRSSVLPDSKYSFRLYFRGDYGAGKLEYPLFPDIPLESFDEIVLRAGMNDHSNPFIRDEMVRMLSADMGMVASHGMFVQMYLNGVYKGLYNPTERISGKFLQAWHGGGEDWDVIAQNGEIREGDAIAWNQLRTLANAQNPTNRATYEQITERLDVDNLIDYLLVNIYAGSQDWPYNNWRAARERAPGGKFRFYVWDAEWSFGYNNSATHNTIANELADSSEIPTLYRRLRLSREFLLRFADRAHKHFFNNGALTDERIRARYESLRVQVASAIPNFNTAISSWITQRRRYVTNHLAAANLLQSSNAPVFSLPAGRVAKNAQVAMSSLNGEIWYTTNGVDPRVPFTSAVHPDARRYTTPLTLSESTLLKARALIQTNWSAVTESEYRVEQLGLPVRITEIMYNPPGGDAYEYIELQNIGAAPLDLSGFTFEGITYRFPENSSLLAPGARLVLASALDPAAFAQRYPAVRVFGNFTSSLNNGGEMIILRDPRGNVVTSVEYNDRNGWPTAADGSGVSLELLESSADPDSPSSWASSAQPGGSPGAANRVPSISPVRINEIFASGTTNNATAESDWIELHNSGSATVNLAGWQLSDESGSAPFTFPQGTSIAAGGYLQVWFDAATNQPGLHSGLALGASGDSVFLHDAIGNRIDAISFGLQLPTYTLGRDERTTQWTLTSATAGRPNEPVTLSTNVVINEAFPNPVTGEDDWLELHNIDTTLPAAIGGYYLSITNTLSRLPALSFIAPGGYAQIIADENAGVDHINFKLPASGAMITLYDALGLEMNRFTYGTVREGASHGRLPNGTGEIREFPASASPAAANYLPNLNGAQISEVLAGGPSDWVELYNPLPTAIDLGGLSLGIDDRESGIWTFPIGTSLAPTSFLVVRCDSASPVSTNATTGFNTAKNINGKGGAVYLFDRSGQLVDWYEFGAQLPNLSIGRYATMLGLLATPTPGTANTPLAALGNPGSVRINEWMAGPIGGDDWIELYNPDANPVHIGGMFLTDDPSVSGRTNSPIAQLTFIAPRGFLLLQADNESDQGAEHVAFSLELFGETLRLYDGVTIVDEVAYLPQTVGISEGRNPDGGASITPFPGQATPGASNVAVGSDMDNDGLPDEWERTHGLDPAIAADALRDSDGDGVSNLDEFRAGTNPTNPSSLLALQVDSNGASALLRFRAAANKSYSILGSDSLESPIWRRVEDIPAGLEREVELSDIPASRLRFYRVVSPMQP